MVGINKEKGRNNIGQKQYKVNHKRNVIDGTKGRR